MPEWLVDELLTFIRERADWIESEAQVEVARDPADDKFLEAAISGQADYIIGGDNDLLDLKTFKGISIVSPGEFVKKK